MLWRFLKAFKDQPDCLSDLLPWVDLPEKDVVRCKDESLLSVWCVEPLDLSGLTRHEQGSLMQRLNTAWKQLDDGWCVWLDVVRHPADVEVPVSAASPVPSLIEADHLAHLAGTLWTNTLYLSLWRRAASRPSLALQQWLSPQAPDAPDASCQPFRDQCAQVVDVLRGSVGSLVPLADDALVTYLHGLISHEWRPVVTPPMASHLDYLLVDRELVPGFQPTLGERWLATVSLKSFPDHLVAAMLADVNRLPLSYRFVLRWLPKDLETNRKHFTKRQEKQVAKGYGIRNAAFEWLTKHPTRIKNRWIEDQADDTDAARFELLSDDVSFGDLSLTVVLAEPDAALLRQQVREVHRVLRSRGLLTVPERLERLNTVEAWLGTIPGLPIPNPRRYWLSSLNALHLAPWHQPWVGKPREARLLATTEGCMPFWFSNMVQDVGHMLVLGPSGSGKTSMVSFLISQWLLQKGAQVFAFDIKRALRAVFLCCGAPYYDLGRDHVALQPLARIDEDHERAWAFDWLLDRLEESHVHRTPAVQRYIEHGLRLLAAKPVDERTMTGLLYVLAQTSTARGVYGVKPETLEALRIEQMAVRQALEAFTTHGAYGYAFDADAEELAQVPMEAFDLLGLLSTPRLVPGMASYLWHALYPCFTGAQTLFVMEEFAQYWKHPAFLEMMKAAIPLLRDKAVSLALVTQNVEDVLDSVLGPTLINNCPTRLLLPNPNALNASSRVAYEALGLAEPDIAQIAAGTPKRDVYVQSPEGRRLIHLPLSPVAKAICGASSTEDHALMDTLLRAHGREHFAVHWLVAKGFPEAAARLQRSDHDSGLCSPVPVGVYGLENDLRAVELAR